VRLGREWRREKKYDFLEAKASVAGVKWDKLAPDDRGTWLTNASDEEFYGFLPIGSKDAKAKGGMDVAIFKLYSLGVATNRDDWVYGFNSKEVTEKVKRLIANYNSEIFRYKAADCPKDVDGFVNSDLRFVKWTDRLKDALKEGQQLKFEKVRVRHSLYRPFAKEWLYFDHLLNQRRYQQHHIFPTPASETENVVICVNNTSERPFASLATNTIANLVTVGGFGAGTQCFRIYSFSDEGGERRENLTPKALTLFRMFYDEDRLSREDIFHYVYALLHHPAYRTRYEENLKRELPRIPFVGVAAKARAEAPAAFFPLAAVEKMQGDAKPDHKPQASAKLFHTFAEAGKKLTELHVNYESAKEFPLQRRENKQVKLDWRVEAMKLTRDKTTLLYNDFLTLDGIPPETYEYRLGNRSALEWVIDQYRVSRDEKGNIVSDPNRMDDEEYIVRLIGQVITVSLETTKIIATLPTVGFE
jgi:predicted helicase